MKKSTALVIFAALNVVFLSIAFVGGYVARAWSEAGQAPGLPVLTGNRYALLDEVRGLLEANYIGSLPADQVLEHGAAKGLVAAVDDPYTVFVEPQAHELQSNQLQGEFGGIGVSIAQDEAGHVVLTPLPTGPAGAAGVKEGDLLVAVDGEPIAPGISLDAVTARVRGPIGSQVTITVRHADGTEDTFTLTRQRIELPSVAWHAVEGQASTGLIAISRFSDKTPGEVERALDELLAQGVTRLVLDLRNNGGGILESAVDVTAHFIDGGVVMYETQRNAPEKVYTVPANSGPATRLPLAVLVNGGTASAAEIVAGALVDRERAPLVGQRTFGKGSVQLVYDLSDGSSLHVTAYRWYTPARRELEQAGLPPTFGVQPAVDGTDAELAYALELLRGQTEGGTLQHTNASYFESEP